MFEDAIIKCLYPKATPDPGELWIMVSQSLYELKSMFEWIRIELNTQLFNQTTIPYSHDMINQISELCQ